MIVHARQFGKGCIPTPPQVKAKHYRLAAVPVRPVDWEKGFNVENGFVLPQRNQDGSMSCTAQATCYYCEAQERVEKNKIELYSARFNYSQSFMPEGGTYIWKAMAIPLSKGLASEGSVPDGDSSEIAMRDKSLNDKAAIEARAEKYAQIDFNDDPDFLANIIEDYHGFVSGFNGKNDMFSPDGTANIIDHSDWGHAEWFGGYLLRDHKDKQGNLVHPKEKTIKSKNSWTGQWGDNGYGYFPECFIKAKGLFDAYVYADLIDLDPLSIPMTDDQLEKLWQAVFKRSIDPNGLSFYRGKSFDVVIADVLVSKENLEYGRIFQAVKQMETDIRNGQF